MDEKVFTPAPKERQAEAYATKYWSGDDQFTAAFDAFVAGYNASTRDAAAKRAEETAELSKGFSAPDEFFKARDEARLMLAKDQADKEDYFAWDPDMYGFGKYRGPSLPHCGHRRREGDLGPNQIAWVKSRIAGQSKENHQ